MFVETSADVAAACERMVELHSGCPMLLLAAEATAEMAEAAARELASRGIAHAGAVFPGILADGEAVDAGLVLLPLPEASRVVVSPPMDDAAGWETFIGRFEKDVPSRVRLLLLFDSASAGINDRLDDLFARLGESVSYAGAKAGSAGFGRIPCLVADGRMFADAMVAVVLPADGPPMMEYSYCPSNERFLATDVEGAIVRSLDWRPAFEVYHEAVKRRFGVSIDRDRFLEQAVHFLMGIERPGGEMLIRHPLRVRKDGAIEFAAEVPLLSPMVLLEGPAEELATGTRRMADRMQAEGWTRPLVFYCAGRRMHLPAESFADELDLIRKAAGPVNGALSLGEIGTSSGDQRPMLHNAAIVAVDLA